MEGTQIAISCYIVRDQYALHKVITLSPDEDIEKYLHEEEDWIYFFDFTTDKFEGKIPVIVDALTLEGAAFFFSELIYIGFREGKRRYADLEACIAANQITIDTTSDNQDFLRVMHTLHNVLPSLDIGSISLQLMQYGLYSVLEMSPEEIYGICQN